MFESVGLPQYIEFESIFMSILYRYVYQLSAATMYRGFIATIIK